MPRTITSEDFLSLPVALVQREAYFLLGMLDRVPEAQPALRAFYARVSSAAAGAREGVGTDAFAAPPVPHAALPPTEHALSPLALRAALCDLAVDGIVHLDTEAHAEQVFNAASEYRRPDELLTRGTTTVTLSRAS